MTINASHETGTRTSLWRAARWSGAALLLLVPLVAMQFTDEVAWDAHDFLVFGAMLLIAIGSYELVARLRRNHAYRAAAAIALAAAFALVWVNLAVGIIGNESNPANQLYIGVLAVGIIGALAARLAPVGMARAMVATAAAQALVAVIALAAGLGNTLPITALFCALWLTSSWLFRAAARGEPAAREGA
jgi:hypothetical protein